MFDFAPPDGINIHWPFVELLHIFQQPARVGDAFKTARTMLVVLRLIIESAAHKMIVNRRALTIKPGSEDQFVTARGSAFGNLIK